MSKDVYRRCGCRENGKQLGNACPRLAGDPKHGTWSYTVSAGTNPRTGKRRQLRGGGFATKREAQSALLAARSKAAAGRMPTDTKVTVAEYLETWLERREVDGLRPSTMAMYRRYVRNDIVPELGRLKLADLRRTDVDRFVRGLVSETRGATTVHRIHSTLSSAMSTAVQLHLLESNPASNVQLPRRTKFRAVVWEPEQANQFLAEVENFRLGVLFKVAIHTGLRRGEVCGLRWQDVSFLERELVVRVQLVEVGGVTSEGEIKTRSGQDRVVALDDDRARLRAQQSGHALEDRRFPRAVGSDQRQQFAARHAQTGIGQSDLPAFVGLGDFVELDGGGDIVAV